MKPNSRNFWSIIFKKSPIFLILESTERKLSQEIMSKIETIIKKWNLILVSLIKANRVRTLPKSQ